MALTTCMTAVAGSIFTAAQFNTNLRDNINTLAASAILQVQQHEYATQAMSTSASFADTGLTRAITPATTSSRILAIVCHNGCQKNTSNTRLQLKILRGATDLGVFEFTGAYTADSGTSAVGSICHFELDSPASTASQTYKTQFANADAAGEVYVQVSSAKSTLTLLEFAA